jgi:hypothetical protein
MRKNPSFPWQIALLAAGAAFLLLRKTGSSSSGPSGPSTPTSSGSGSSLTFNIPGFTPLRGNDPRWGAQTIGGSSSTIGRVGCLVTALAMATNVLLRTNITPADVNRVGQQNPGSFSGANMILSTLARALGLSAPDSIRLRDFNVSQREAVRRRIDETLQRGGIPILHVDYDRRQVAGAFEGDHFITCIGRQDIPEMGVAYLCADPATGTIKPIFRNTLTGPGFSGREFLVVGVAPVFRGNEAPTAMV